MNTTRLDGIWRSFWSVRCHDDIQNNSRLHCPCVCDLYFSIDTTISYDGNCLKFLWICKVPVSHQRQSLKCYWVNIDIFLFGICANLNTVLVVDSDLVENLKSRRKSLTCHPDATVEHSKPAAVLSQGSLLQQSLRLRLEAEANRSGFIQALSSP